MYGYERMASSTVGLMNSLNTYLDTGSEFSQGLTHGHALAAWQHGTIFFTYFQDDLSYELDNKLRIFYHHMALWTGEKKDEKLIEAVDQLEKLIGTFNRVGLEERGWRYSAIPSHPFDHKQAERLLSTITEINEALIR